MTTLSRESCAKNAILWTAGQGVSCEALSARCRSADPQEATCGAVTSRSAIEFLPDDKRGLQ
jgi:hypothetical protein